MRRLRTALILLAMVAFGIAVNRYIDSRKTIAQAAPKPNATRAAFSLPGTIYVAQQGKIYALSDGAFSEMPLPDRGFWMQPHALPDGSLLVIARSAAFSDLYHVSAGGAVLAQLTHNNVDAKKIQLNHWIYWPTVSADGRTVFAAVDDPKPLPQVSYQEDLSLWAGPINGALTTTQWTTGNPYSGGDIDPQPLRGGGIVYVTYGPDNAGHIVGQVGYQATPQSPTVALTTPEDDCGAAAVAPDGVTVAMVCTADTQTAKLEIAHLHKGLLDTPTVLVRSCLCNSPSWAPDGSGLLYLSPADSRGRFQLWWIGAATTPSPAVPRAVTSEVDLDATSAAAWFIAAAPGPTSR